MRRIFIFCCFYLLLPEFINAQTYYPNIYSQGNKDLKISKVERNPSSTIIDFEYYMKDSIARVINLNPHDIDTSFYIQANGIKFLLLGWEGISNMDSIIIGSINKSLKFSGIFEPLPKSVAIFDLIEGKAGLLSFYSINISNPLDNPNKFNFKNSDTLYYDSQRMGVDSMGAAAFYRVINLDSNGNISGLVKDYYPTGELFGKGDALHIDRFDDNNSKWRGTVFTYSKTGNVLKEIDSDKLCKTYYKDGKTYKYFVHNGISVAMHLSIDRSYGKYYVADISIENFTGNSFNFDPSGISAIMTKGKIETYGKVLSSNEYMKKVNNRQAWNTAFLAYAESSLANKAGYSNSTKTTTKNGYNNAYGGTSLYGVNIDEGIYGSSNTQGSSTTRSYTQSYSGSANYLAQQNAQQKINSFKNQQYEIKDVLNQGYLKLNTIENEQKILGQINIIFVSADKIMITIPLNGNNYDFWWDLN